MKKIYFLYRVFQLSWRKHRHVQGLYMIYIIIIVPLAKTNILLNMDIGLR